MADTTINGAKSRKPIRKVRVGAYWGLAAAAVPLIVGVPLLNEFVFSPENRIDLTPKDYFLPFIPVAVTFAAAWAAKHGNAEGTT
jgi:hypothetical protein